MAVTKNSTVVLNSNFIIPYVRNYSIFVNERLYFYSLSWLNFLFV